MSRQIIPLKSRVRYEGRVQIFDRRGATGIETEKLPDPVWLMVSCALRGKFRKFVRTTPRRRRRSR